MEVDVGVSELAVTLALLADLVEGAGNLDAVEVGLEQVGAGTQQLDRLARRAADVDDAARPV